MTIPLPGTRLPLVGYKLEPPYSIPEDDTKLYLCFGSEDVVRSFDQAVSVAEVDVVLRLDRARRATHDFFRRGLPT